MLKDGDISKQAKINPAKLKPADEAQLLVAQPDGKFKAISINGDATLSSDGTLTVAGSGQAPVVERNPALDEPELAEGQIAVGGATRSERVNLGTGANAIPQRDSSGNLKAETADQATNATNADNATNSTKLNNQAASFYTDVSNHDYGTPTTTTDGGNNKTTTKRVHEVVEYVPATSYGSSNYPISFEHLMPYIPDVSVYLLDNDEYFEVDADVKATAASGNTAGTIKVDVSESNLNLKIIAS